MRIFTIFLFSTYMLTICFADADPKSSRFEIISVDTNTDAQYHFEEYRKVLAAIGRQIISFQVAVRNPSGSIKTLGFRHQLINGKDCQNNWDVKQVRITSTGNLYVEIGRQLQSMKLAHRIPIDMEIAGIFQSGRPASVAIYYCE